MAGYGDEMSTGLGYWIRWQVPVCAMILVIPSVIATVVIMRSKMGPLMRSSDIWIPCWKKMHPLWLLAFRALVLFAMFYLLIHLFLCRGVSIFYFYSYWTFTSVIFYFMIATLISAHGCWTYYKEHAATNSDKTATLLSALRCWNINSKRPLEERDNEENASALLLISENRNEIKLQKYYHDHQGEDHAEPNAGFWGHLLLIVYHISAGAVMLTNLLFWGYVVPYSRTKRFEMNLVTGSMHVLNLVFLLFDNVLINLPFHPFGIAYFMLLSCIYTFFQWGLHASGLSWWPYFVLELATPWAPFWYLCVLVAHIPCYVLYRLILEAKNSICIQLFPDAYLRP